MKKLFISALLILCSASVVYAGCFTTQNFSPSAVDSNKSRLALQCYAMRSGGSWSISADGLSATQSGGSTYSTSSVWWDGSTNRFDIIQNGSGSHVVQVSYQDSGPAQENFHLPAAPAEAGVCSVVYSTGGYVTGWGLVFNGTFKAKYCR